MQASLITYPERRNPKQGASRTEKGNTLLQEELPDWKTATPCEVNRIHSNWVKDKGGRGRSRPPTQFRTKRLTSPTSLKPAQ